MNLNQYNNIVALYVKVTIPIAGAGPEFGKWDWCTLLKS